MTGHSLKTKIRLFAASVLIAAGGSCFAQNVAIKTNLVSDALASPSLGIEFGLAPKWTLDISGQVNFWDISDHKWRHWLAQPEARYWFCRRFMGHFIGVHALGGEFNVGNIDLGFDLLGTNFRNFRSNRYVGWGAGAGIAYGYDWVLGRHWNIEAEVGLGWIYTRYDVYPCTVCGRKIASDRHHNYFGPTKLTINVVYTF